MLAAHFLGDWKSAEFFGNYAAALKHRAWPGQSWLGSAAGQNRIAALR
jgi:hypothetical protein